METIAEAKQYLNDNFENGVECPCCGQNVKKYKYNLFATSALALIDLYKLVGKAQVSTHPIYMNITLTEEEVRELQQGWDMWADGSYANHAAWILRQVLVREGWEE